MAGCSTRDDDQAPEDQVSHEARQHPWRWVNFVCCKDQDNVILHFVVRYHTDACMASDVIVVREELAQHKKGMRNILVFLLFNRCVVRIQYWLLRSSLNSLLPSIRKREGCTPSVLLLEERWNPLCACAANVWYFQFLTRSV
jgi:hypothetical protein